MRLQREKVKHYVHIHYLCMQYVSFLEEVIFQVWQKQDWMGSINTAKYVLLMLLLL